MLKLASLTVAAGEFRLRDVNLAVAEGECHAVLGPSGSGKTTLLNAILGLLPLESGAIMLNGADITQVPIELRGLGYVPQHLGLFPHLTVRDNLAYSARARNIPTGQFLPLVEKLVELTGIGALLDRRPRTLSGGERQRVGIVRALASQPRLLLLDEPFTALNESLRRELWALMRELQRDRKLTVLLITHDLTEAYFLSERVTVLLDGRVMQQGDKATVYCRPAGPEVAHFLGVENLLPGRIISVSGGLATVEVGKSRLVAPAPSDAVTDNVLVSIRGEDVTLVRNGSAPASMCNQQGVQVVSVLTGHPLLTVKLDAGFPLFASMTRSACDELGVYPGAEVIAQIKIPAIYLIDLPAKRTSDSNNKNHTTLACGSPPRGLPSGRGSRRFPRVTKP